MGRDQDQPLTPEQAKRRLLTGLEPEPAQPPPPDPQRARAELLDSAERIDPYELLRAHALEATAAALVAGIVVGAVPPLRRLVIRSATHAARRYLGV